MKVDELAAKAEQSAREAEDKNAVLLAKYNALRSEHGLFTEEDDFTAQANFDELERQYKVFTRFFKSEWKKAKKRIRREVLRGIRTKGGKAPTDAEQKSEQPEAQEQSSEQTNPQEQPEAREENTLQERMTAAEDAAERERDEE